MPDGARAGVAEVLHEAIRNPLYPTPWRSYCTASQRVQRLGKLDQAEAYYAQALKVEPDELVTLLRLGELRLKQGKVDRERRMVTRFQRIYEPSAESLWLATRVEINLGESVANQLRRRLPNSPQYQLLQRGENA